MELPPKTILAWVPKSAQLHIDSIQDLALLRKRLPHPVGSDAAIAAEQALALLWHVARGADSALLPHILRLPGIAADADVPCTAPVFPDEALEQLQDRNTATSIRELKAKNHQFVQQVLAPLAGSPDDPFSGMKVNSELFGWAVATSLSRCYDQFGMPALIDFLDHSSEPNVLAGSFVDCCSEPGQMHMGTQKKVSKGEALYMSYGEMSNQALLLSYGFILPGNSGQYAVQATIPPGTELSPEQVQALLTVDAVAASKRATSSSSGTNSGPKQLVFLDQYENPVQPRQLRLVAKQLKQQEGMRVLLNDLYAGRPGGVEGMCDWSSALSKEEEERVQLSMLKSLEAQMASFPTSIQHDEQELARAQTEASSARSLGRAEAHAEEPSTLEEADALLKEAVARIASGLHQPSYSEALCLAIAWRLEVKQALRRSADCIQARLQELQSAQQSAPQAIKGFGTASGAGKAGGPKKRK